MEKQKTSIFIALVLVLLIIAAIVAWITHDSSDEPNNSPEPVPTSTADVVVTTDIPAETDTPATPSATPTPTHTPTATAKPDVPSGDGRVSQSGSFTSDTGTKLNLVVEWKAVSIDEHTLSVTVNVYVQSYSLDIGQRTGNTVSVNGTSYAFVSGPVTHKDNNSLQKTLVTTLTVNVPAEAGSSVSIPVSVDWNFRGTYSGEEIEHIVAENVIAFSA